MTDHDLLPADEGFFDDLAETVLGGLGSPHSRRVYRAVYRKWRGWCAQHGIHPLMLSGPNVYQFLVEQPAAKSTRSQHLAALKKLVAWLAIHHEGFERFYKELGFIRVPSENGSGAERSKSALTPAQVYKLLNFWSGSTPTHIRNHALICTALATGARRSELAALEWKDVNLADGTVTIRHGKGDKHREAAIVGEFAVEALRRWDQIQGEGWRYVFVPVDKGGGIGPDKPIDATTLYKVFRRTSEGTGVPFSPHDLRRTLATELFIQGAMASDVQAQLGHADASTTMRYALAGDAMERRKRFRTRWEK